VVHQTITLIVGEAAGGGHELVDQAANAAARSRMLLTVV
jgi:hypothetical protein